MKFCLFITALLISASAYANEECDQFIQGLPASAVHGYITVPEDHSDFSSKQIKVFYWGLNLKENPDVSPLVYFNGGPGSMAHGMDVYLKDLPHFPKVPFLFIDQRGTGCSDPFPIQEFTREGVQKIALYGARSIVMDAEVLRKTVFHGMKWRIFGQSFGSLIVHRYLELAPEGLTAAIAHGFALMEDGIAWTETRVRAFKRVGEEYFKKYPADRELILRAHILFPKDYCMKSPEVDTCGDGLLDMLAWNSLSFPNFGLWEKLHTRIQKLFLPTGELDMAYIEKLFPKESGSDPTMLLVDVVPAREGPGGLCNTWSCELAISQMETKNEHPMRYEFNECRLALAMHRHFDYNIVKEVIGEDLPSLKRIKLQLMLHPQLKYFLYSGALDTFAPMESYQQELSTLGRRVNYRGYASGHGSFFEEEGTWLDILSTQ